MARFATTVTSGAEADIAYRFLADFSNIVDWDPGVLEASRVAGKPAEPGAVYRVLVPFGPRRIWLDYHVLSAKAPAVDSPGSISLRAENRDFVSLDLITVQPTATGCEVTYDAELTLAGVRRVFDPFLRLAFQVIGRRAESGLKDILADPTRLNV